MTADAVLLHPLTYPNPDQLVVMQETLPAHNLKEIAPSPEDFADFRKSARTLAQIAAMISGDANLSEGAPEDVDDAQAVHPAQAGAQVRGQVGDENSQVQ